MSPRNNLYRHFNRLPYDLYVEHKTRKQAELYAGFARWHGKKARIVRDKADERKKCVYVLGAKSLPPFSPFLKRLARKAA